MCTASRLLALSISLTTTLVFAAPSPEYGWSFRSSVAARTGYDTNLFLQDRGPTLPAVADPAPDRAAAWFVRASVSLEASWRLSPAFQLDAAYTPELVRFEEFASENHDNHRVDLGVSGRQNAWSYQLKTTATLVDGSDEGPVYGHAGGGPAIGGVGVRARREQINGKLAGHLTRTSDSGFVRLVADGCSNDYDTRLISTAVRPGYANYVDRSEWSTGVDFGRILNTHLALFVGVRGGAQHQDDLVGTSTNYSNDLTRLLIGLEGKPRADLTLRVAAGPDFRYYGDTVAPGFNRDRTARYVEASATYTPTSADTLALTAKDHLWLSASGPCAYQHTQGTLQWKHAFNSRWTFTVAADVQAGDSRDYAVPGAGRLDWIYTGTLGLAYALDARTKIDAEIVREWSDCTYPGTPGREYTRWQFSLGVRRQF